MGSGFSNDVCVCKNLNTANDGTKDGKFTTDGQLLIGSTAAPNARVGNISAGSNKLSVANSSGSIAVDAVEANFSLNNIGGTLGVSKGGTGMTTFPQGAVLLGELTNPFNSVNLSAGQVVVGTSVGSNPVGANITNGNNVTWTNGSGTLQANVTGTTNHAIQLGNASGSLTSTGVGVTGQFIRGNAGADPTWDAPGYMPGVYNVGFKYNGSTFTIASSDQTDFSATNVGYVLMHSVSTPGKTIKIQITANKSFIDYNGSSNIKGALFGLTTNLNWATKLPMYVYCIMNAAENAYNFAISRVPHLYQVPATAHIGQIGASSTADIQSSMFILDSSLTLSQWTLGPALCIGSFQIQKLGTTNNDWQVQSFVASDGIGLFNDSTVFTMPVAVFGAATGSYFTANGGTAPIFSTQNYYYSVSKDGKCYITCNFASASTPGAGEVVTQLIAPYINGNGNVIPSLISGYCYYSNSSIDFHTYNAPSSSNQMGGYKTSGGGTSIPIYNDGFSGIVNPFIISGRYGISATA